MKDAQIIAKKEKPEAAYPIDGRSKRRSTENYYFAANSADLLAGGAAN
ncbi:hypothetical protein [Paenibacillus arenilitoris]|uniref:Uncharacterized protein n=1 Tax=Paenibacillus arenilitoris TaxID=2772299 RepID=A0A927CMN6_9BACL|nr:hypothetical protein [Paenibacillus arenilitoris]MBD2869632.1 hypothetical protein [Paenibacillus arenilitoris]